MEDSNPFSTSYSEGKDLEALSDGITSLGYHNSTDNVSSTGLSDNQQINEGNETDNTTDVQKVPVEGHDIKEKEEEDENEEAQDDISDVKAESKRDIKEPESKSDDEEEKREDDAKPPRQEPVTAPTTDINLVSALKGSRGNEDKPPKGVTWSPTLEEFASSEDETDESDDQGKDAGKSRQKGGGKNAGEGGSKSSRRGGRKGAGKGKKKGKKHGGGSSKYFDHGEY